MFGHFRRYGALEARPSLRAWRRSGSSPGPADERQPFALLLAAKSSQWVVYSMDAKLKHPDLTSLPDTSESYMAYCSHTPGRKHGEDLVQGPVSLDDSPFLQLEQGPRVL